MTAMDGSNNFRSTHWSVVLAAGAPASPESNSALESLCQLYWYPLYTYARRRGLDAEQSQDLTQAFFVRVLEKDLVAVADPARGRFRAFLLKSFQSFLSNEWDKSQAQVRGGDRLHLSLDFQAGEKRFRQEPADDLTPEHGFEQQWAWALLQSVMQQLEEEYARSGKHPLFVELRSFITPTAEAQPYSDVAERLDITDGAVRVAVYRLRKRYGELLRQAIADTVTDAAEVDDEIHQLFAAFGQR